MSAVSTEALDRNNSGFALGTTPGNRGGCRRATVFETVEWGVHLPVKQALWRVRYRIVAKPLPQIEFVQKDGLLTRFKDKKRVDELPKLMEDNPDTAIFVEKVKD
jgi:hypothetical protein